MTAITKSQVKKHTFIPIDGIERRKQGYGPFLDYRCKFCKLYARQFLRSGEWKVNKYEECK